MNPGMDHNEATISQHYYWKNLRDDICTHIKARKTFKINKNQNLKYRNSTAKKAEAVPWERVSVDLIYSYKIIREGHY